MAKIDAKGQTTAYQYDAINRLKRITYSDTSTVSYVYDQGSNGAGHLTSMVDTAGNTSWAYDADGHVVQKVQADGGATLTTSYGYDSAGRLASLTLPSGHVVGLTWNANHIANVSVDTQAIASDISSEPFGEPNAWSFANGEQVTRTFDASGRMTGNSLGTIGYDTGNRITSLSPGGVNISMGNKTYGYDLLDHLTSYGSSGSTSIAYSYDADGNRTQQSGTGTLANINISGSSSRISAVSGGSSTINFSYDANGSTTSDISNSYGYDASGRLSVANTASYLYDGKGQRTVKVNSSTATLFNYDESGHLLGEYNVSGIPIEETIWLGNIPLATINSGGVYYIHTDHLNTPRQIDDGSKKAVWAWDSITFGANAPNQDPQGTGTSFIYNLRMPGQYLDAESGLFHNGWRDYDPTLGRYVESDPIGLAGGVNTYAYVGGDPISYVDPFGLAECTLNFSDGAGVLSCIPDDPANGSVNIPVASGNNGGGSNCKNNLDCQNDTGTGPIPAGCWQWTGGYTSKQNGRTLAPCSGWTSNRTDILSHSCANAFGPSKNPPFCSEGCVTGSPSNMQALNGLLDAEPNSTLWVGPPLPPVVPPIDPGLPGYPSLGPVPY